jgi:hypothetical protein
MKHKCKSNQKYNFECYEWNDGILYLSANEEYETIVSFCPFCGFQPERSKREDKCTHILNKDAKTICFACDCEYI